MISKQAKRIGAEIAEHPKAMAEVLLGSWVQGVMYSVLTADMLGVSCNTLCRWENTRELIADVFSRQALPMLWDFAELNPFSGGSGSWSKVFGYVRDVLAHLTAIPPVEEGK